MSLYNIMFGENPASEAILATLGLSPTDCGRFRDCFIAKGEIAVYTRNGGNNREDCMPDFSQHPNYLRDEDDDFDSTYATIYFSFPDTYAEELKRLDGGETFDPSERWLKALEALKQHAG